MKQRLKQHLLARKPGITEWVVLGVWLLLVCTIRHFHEPWFDETQAWQIARFASLKELLFEVEHFEGHPPLWHLLLMPFARLEFPYKPTIFCITLAFDLAAAVLLLFRSPFPRWLRCYLPFTFYFFYMHTVHTRPYCMTMLAFLLAAMTYHRRQERPGRYTLSLIFLCLTSLYGILFSFGLCLVWFGEILAEHRSGKAARPLVRDGRCWWLVVIAAVAVLLYLMIRPAEGVYYSGTEITWHSRLTRIYFFPALLYESTFGSSMHEVQVENTTFDMALCTIAGAALWTVLLPLLKRNGKLLLCLVPYVITAGFSAFVHFIPHHLDVFNQFFVFIFWILFAEGITLPEIYGNVRRQFDSPMTMRLLEGVGVVLFCAPLAYTAASSYYDIRYRYGPLEMANFIKEHHLEDRKIMCWWEFDFDRGDDVNSLSDMIWDETLPYQSSPPLTRQNDSLMGDPVSVYAFFDRDADFFAYFNVFETQRKWLVWREDDEERLRRVYDKWAEIGLPDFIFSTVPLQEVYPPEMLEGVTYYWVDDLNYGKIWKFDYEKGIDHVYIREDLLEEYPEFEIKKYATILSEPVS